MARQHRKRNIIVTVTVDPSSAIGIVKQTVVETIKNQLKWITHITEVTELELIAQRKLIDTPPP